MNHKFHGFSRVFTDEDSRIRMDVIIVMNATRSKGSKRLNPNFLIRDHPVRQDKPGFSIDLKCDQHVK